MRNHAIPIPSSQLLASYYYKTPLLLLLRRAPQPLLPASHRLCSRWLSSRKILGKEKHCSAGAGVGVLGFRVHGVIIKPDQELACSLARSLGRLCYFPHVPICFCFCFCVCSARTHALTEDSGTRPVVAVGLQRARFNGGAWVGYCSTRLVRGSGVGVE
ncbi:hypothetical protein DFP73DRAFT_539790 [Morchella snyderi]|nr:hypothetical protein DFP73DRAFT_539790 [Morchella snyderi]